MNLIEKIKLNLKALRSVLGKEKDIIQETQDSQLNKGKPILHKSVETLNTKIDDYSYVSNNSIIHNCKIGKFCSIGPNVVIGFGEHPTSFISTSPLFYAANEGMFNTNLYTTNSFIQNDAKKIVQIGNDVWIGANVYIKNGITIGDGAVIGAGAIVTSSVQPYAIVVGVPAKVLRYRFSQEKI